MLTDEEFKDLLAIGDALTDIIAVPRAWDASDTTDEARLRRLAALWKKRRALAKTKVQ